MSTTPKKTTVDLSKAKIGQKLQLRSGKIVPLWGVNSALDFPYQGRKVGLSWFANGRALHVREDEDDVVAILPLPNKAAKPKPDESDVETLTSLFAKIAFSNDPAWVKRAIKALQFVEGGKKA